MSVETDARAGIAAPREPTAGEQAPAAAPARAAARRRRWPGVRKAVLTLHIVSSVGLAGSLGGMVVAASRAATRDDQAAAHTLYDLLRMLPFALGIPLSFTALITGAVLALTSRWRLVRHWWVTGKLVLLLGTILLGALVTGRSADDLAAATAPGGAGMDGEWTLVAVLALQLAMVLVASVLSVFKPGGVTPWSRARDGR